MQRPQIAEEVTEFGPPDALSIFFELRSLRWGVLAQGGSMSSTYLHPKYDLKRGSVYRKVRMHALHGARKDRVSAPPGFLLVDRDLNPIYANTEAVRILTYPPVGKTRAIKKFLPQRVQSVFAEARGASKSPLIARIQSGKRHYWCRFFSIARSARGNRQPEIALLIEREA
jgi:hypothetical protein